MLYAGKEAVAFLSFSRLANIFFVFLGLLEGIKNIVEVNFRKRGRGEKRVESSDSWVQSMFCGTLGSWFGGCTGLKQISS